MDSNTNTSGQNLQHQTNTTSVNQPAPVPVAEKLTAPFTSPEPVGSPEPEMAGGKRVPEGDKLAQMQAEFDKVNAVGSRLAGPIGSPVGQEKPAEQEIPQPVVQQMVYKNGTPAKDGDQIIYRYPGPPALIVAGVLHGTMMVGGIAYGTLANPVPGSVMQNPVHVNDGYRADEAYLAMDALLKQPEAQVETRVV